MFIFVLLVYFIYDIITKAKQIKVKAVEEEIQENDEKIVKPHKEKSVRKIKKEHKISDKKEKKETKKLARVQKHLAKKYGKTKSHDENDINGEKTLNAEPDEFEKQSINTASGKTEQDKVLIVRKVQQGKPLTMKRKILNLISYALVGVIAIAFGYIAGNFYYANYMDQPNYNFNTSELRDNGEEIYNRLQTTKNTIGIARQNPVEIVVAAEYLMSITTKYKGSVVGAVQPSIGSQQTVRGTKGRDGNHFYVENYSKGMMSIAEKYDYFTDTDKAEVFRVEGGAVKTDSANFGTKPTWTFNKASYIEEYGTAPDSLMIPYVISSKTYIEGSDTVTALGGGKFQVKMSLTNDKAVADYAKQVKHMSGLANYPRFERVIVSFVIDSDYRIVSLRYDESYSVTYFGVPAKCVGWLEVNIEY